MKMITGKVELDEATVKAIDKLRGNKSRETFVSECIERGAIELWKRFRSTTTLH